MEHANLLKPTAKRPMSLQFRGSKVRAYGIVPVGAIGLIRDQLSLSSWIALGACLQTLAYVVFGRAGAVPAFLLVLLRVLDTALVTVGLRRNTLMDGVIMNKAAVHFPDAECRFVGKPSNKDIVVFHIGARINHPLGTMAPGAKELGDFFVKMTLDVEARAEEYGLLGQTSYIANGARSSNNEVLTVMFFENVEGLHKYAHDELHRECWHWWNTSLAKMPHISIWHEVFQTPAGCWEGIYINSNPRGLGAVTVPVTLKEDMSVDGEGGQVLKEGTKVFYSPLVDARRGLFKTSAARMSASGSAATEHDKYADDPYA